MKYLNVYERLKIVFKIFGKLVNIKANNFKNKIKNKKTFNFTRKIRFTATS